MKDLYGICGYLGSCEPDGEGGYNGKLLHIGGEAPEYHGKTLREVRAAHIQATRDYLTACNDAGIHPAPPPEPFFAAQGMDVLFSDTIRWDDNGRTIYGITKYYSLKEVFFRGRVSNGTARTLSAWCRLEPMKGRKLPRKYVSDRELADEMISWVERYGCEPCPFWS